MRWSPPQEALPSARAERDDWQTLRMLLPYLWAYKGRVLFALACLVAAKLATVSVPILLKGIVDTLAPAAKSATDMLVVPVALVVAYGLLRLSTSLFTELREFFFVNVTQAAMRTLALKTFRHLHSLSLRYHLERRTGAVTREIDQGIRGISSLISFTLYSILPTLIEITLVVAYLVWNYEVWFAVIVGVSLVVYILFTVNVTNWRTVVRRRWNELETKAQSRAVDSLLNFETVKYFGNEEHEAERFGRSMEIYEKAAIKTWVSLAVLNAGQALIFSIGLTIVMVMSALAVRNGQATVGDFVLVNALMIQLYMPLNFIGSSYREIKQGLIDVEQMFQLLKVNAEIKDKPGATPLKVAEAEVNFDNVSFAYDHERPILRDLSFTIPAGKTVAIVGPSGAGKSTASRLLYRFYDVTGGRILVDGQDIAGVTQKSLRAAIGMVPQDTVLFNDTIRYNIRYGRPDATDAEVEAAAKMAQIHDFVMSLPKGYDSLVGERGLKLSGGEKQRVSIARTILKGPAILILDEATSALDSFTEHQIQEALKKVSENRTTLVIAHRLSTVVDADEIIVLDKGKVAERGTHEKLLRKQGIYHAMWNRQRQADEAREKLKEAEEEPLEGSLGAKKPVARKRVTT